MPIVLPIIPHEKRVANVPFWKFKAMIIEVLCLMEGCAMIGGDHHKQWVLDQIVRELTGDNYNKWVADYEAGEDGPKTYHWDTGIAP